MSAAIRSFDLDLAVSRWFYRGEIEPSWWGKGRPILDLLYRHGTLPANLVAGAGLVGWLVSLFRSGLRRHRRTFALLFLTLVIGPGLLVNGVGKEHWGRPRPREVVEFGGRESFLPVGAVDWDGKGESFPSGHASTGFYFFALCFIWRARRPRAAAAGAAGAIVAGSLLGFQRIAVGAHFLSDVLWSGGIVYLTALALDASLPKMVRMEGER